MVRQELEKVDVDAKQPSLLSEPNHSLVDTIYQFMLNFTEEISIRYFFWLQESLKKNNKVNKLHFSKVESILVQITDAVFSQVSSHTEFVLEKILNNLRGKSEDDSWWGGLSEEQIRATHQRVQVGQSFEVVDRDADVPEGSALATLEEATTHKSQITQQLQEFSVVALEGGKIDGPGYGNNVSDKEAAEDCKQKLLIVKHFQIQECVVKQKKNLGFEMAKENINLVLFKKSPFIYIIRLLTQNYGIHIKLTASLSEKICQGTLKCLKAMSLYFKIWNQFGEKLDMGDINAKLEDSHKVRESLEYNLTDVYQHLSYYLGHLAYNYVKIEPAVEAPKAKDEDPEK